MPRGVIERAFASTIVRGPLAAAAAVGLAILASASVADAQRLYRYIDQRGVVHFTNVPQADERFHRVDLTPQGARPRGVDLDARPPIHHGFDSLIQRAADAYRLDPGLVKAVVAAESAFNTRALSRKGAMGLMQLMPATARALGVSEPLEAAPNVFGGTRYLRDMIERYGDVSRALAAYNAGPRAVDRYRGIPPYRETRDYVARVLDYYRVYQSDFHRPVGRTQVAGR